MRKFFSCLRAYLQSVKKILSRWRPVYFGRFPQHAPAGSILLFPFHQSLLRCGLASILEFKKTPSSASLNLQSLFDHLCEVKSIEDFLQGQNLLLSVLEQETLLREDDLFCILAKEERQQQLLRKIVEKLKPMLLAVEGDWQADEAKNVVLLRLRDIVWRIEREHLTNLEGMQALAGEKLKNLSPALIVSFRRIHSILNMIDRLEIRGRDSAGFVITLPFPEENYLAFSKKLVEEGLLAAWEERKKLQELVHLSIRQSQVEKNQNVSFIFKVCNIIGRLGDNVQELRKSIREDKIFHLALTHTAQPIGYLAHTRWASNGIINIFNCHPLDNAFCTKDEEEKILTFPNHPHYPQGGHMFAVLNGDIDNYDALKAKMAEEDGIEISERITTDAKIISLAVQQAVKQGLKLDDAFRKAVGGFEGSHAIALQSDLEPGKLYLALKGSGQAIYIGLGKDRYIVASEVYGIVEDTDRYITMDGETPRIPGKPESQGQIFILDYQKTGIEGISTFYYDGTSFTLSAEKIKRAEITTRDIDRQNFTHFFAKEIHEASSSMLNTLRGKFQCEAETPIDLNKILAPKIIEALKKQKIKKIYTIGQGTASIAAMAIAYRMEKTLDKFQVKGLKSSELSGFYLKPDMADSLVIAVTQSGTTTDTNRAIDMVKKRGAYTMAIVNRRNSHITNMVDSVFYTSNGRDIEMSVASTKAFYSQVTAGEILTVGLGHWTQSLAASDVKERLQALKNLPSLLGEVLAKKDKIAQIAEKWTLLRKHWALVGSGANFIAAQEVRIKLSELCYKSIACDYVEDKKHIDLSCEPMILVCAAGTPASVLGDIIKDVAIFKAHNALPIVITQEGERRFDPYAVGIIEVPKADELSSLILNTLAGHLFGYYAAQTINQQSRFFASLRDKMVGAFTGGNANDFLKGAELQKEIQLFSKEFHQRRQQGLFVSVLSPSTCTEIGLLLAHAMGQLRVQHFGDEFGQTGTPQELWNLLVDRLHRAVEEMSRPIDAIKHQAKTVTVGTSRLETPVSDLKGVLFDRLLSAGIRPEELRVHIIQRLRQLQPAIARIKGYSYYEIAGLNATGQPTPESTVHLLKREGIAANLPSRSALAPVPLVGTKRNVIQKGDLFIGFGLGDRRPILIIPIFSNEGIATHQILFHIDFVERVSLEEAKVIVYPIYEEIQNMITEANIPWSDQLLTLVSPYFLVSSSPKDIVEEIIKRKSEKIGR